MDSFDLTALYLENGSDLYKNVVDPFHKLHYRQFRAYFRRAGKDPNKAVLISSILDVLEEQYSAIDPVRFQRGRVAFTRHYLRGEKYDSLEADSDYPVSRAEMFRSVDFILDCLGVWLYGSNWDFPFYDDVCNEMKKEFPNLETD